MNNPEQILPPHSVSAEQAVLGGLMLDNDRWDDIATIVSADRFYSRPHGVIFSAMQTLLLQNKPIDLITLAESMEQQGTLEQCGGFAYLAELSKNTPSAANIVAYAEYVASYGQKRQLLALGHDLVGQASDARSDLMVLLEEAERRLFAIAEQQSLDGDVDLPASLEAFLNRLEQRCGSEDLITGTPTGFVQLNTMTSGFQSSDLILLAGRPSMGKTALGLAFCEGALFAAPRLTPSGPARQARCSTPTALVRVRAPLFKEPSLWLGFCFWGASTSFPSKSPHPLCQKKFIARDFACPTLSRINCLSVGPLVLRENPYHQRR